MYARHVLSDEHTLACYLIKTTPRIGIVSIPTFQIRDLRLGERVICSRSYLRGCIAAVNPGLRDSRA